jgi:hypothetical protein
MVIEPKVPLGSALSPMVIAEPPELIQQAGPE